MDKGKAKGEGPEVGSLWEYEDEVFKIESVYAATGWEGGKAVPVTLVKLICVDPMPSHIRLEKFAEKYAPYDPDAP